MKGFLRINWCKPHIILHISHQISTNRSMCLNSCTHNKIPIGHTASRTSTHHSNHTCREGVVETSEEEVEEEDLVEEEAKLRAITLDNQVTIPYIV